MRLARGCRAGPWEPCNGCLVEVRSFEQTMALSWWGFRHCDSFRRRSLLWEASWGQAGSGLGLETGRGMVSCLPLASERQLFAGP